VKGQEKLNRHIIFESALMQLAKTLSILVGACRNYSLAKLAHFCDTGCMVILNHHKVVTSIVGENAAGCGRSEESESRVFFTSGSIEEEEEENFCSANLRTEEPVSLVEEQAACSYAPDGVGCSTEDTRG